MGGAAETKEVIDFCPSRNITADVEIIAPAEINKAYSRVMNKIVRYRFVIDVGAGAHGLRICVGRSHQRRLDNLCTAIRTGCQNLAMSVMPPTKSNPPMIRPAFSG